MTGTTRSQSVAESQAPGNREVTPGPGDRGVAPALTDCEPVSIIHVIGPLGEPKCPECQSVEVERCGSWDWGPFYWECENCNHQWGHA